MGPISMFVPLTVLAVMAMPLALNLIPPNRVYGYRTAQTLASRQSWFRINRVAGVSLIVAAAVALSIYVVHPELASGRSPGGVLVLVLAVVSALVITAMYARNIANRTD